MKYRRALFFVTYYLEKGKPKYLILKKKLHWKGWEFPKGGQRVFETARETIKREIREETGLKVLKIKKFKESGKYKYPKKYKNRPGFIGQTYKLYSVRVQKGKVKFDKYEHSDYKWMNFSDAVKKLTWKNQKECLGIVEKSI